MTDPEPEAAAPDTGKKGPLAWMAQNIVAANLIMLLLLIGGAMMLPNIKQEVFPEFELDLVVVNVPYPGASPTEVEQGVILAIEEAVQGLDGIKEIRSTASESTGVVVIELLTGTDPDRALSDMKAAIDRITSFPEDIERPVVSLALMRRQVASLVVYGDRTEAELRTLAENARDALVADDEISYVELGGVRPYEISVEVPEESSRRYGLNLGQIATRIRAASVDLPGGGVRTDSGEVLLRTTERRHTGEEFGDIVLLSQPDGTEVRVRDVGTVVDGFAETDLETYYSGRPAAVVNVFRVGDETPIDVSDAIKRFVAENEANLPEGVHFDIWSDMSEIYRDRIDLLLRNAYIGLILVLLTLGLFLEIRLAFWVTMGIPISFVGSLLFLPMGDVSINMISLFAFIITLGMVVDDAIVVGEAVYNYRQKGLNFLDSAIAGVREVAGPVVFAIATSCMAFAPLLFVPGVMGKFFKVIPIIVITVLLISLVESLVILPAHLAHSKRSHRGILGFIDRQQQRFSRLVEWLIERTYVPTVRFALKNRYFTAACGISMLIAAVGLVAGGRIGFTFMPKIERDEIKARLEMPFGTSIEQTRRARALLEESLTESLATFGDPTVPVRGVFAYAGAHSGGSGPGGGRGSNGSHMAEVSVYLVPMADREFTAADLTRVWREKVGDIAGAETLTFEFSSGPSDGSPIDIELSHPDMETLETAAQRLAGIVGTYAGVKDINDGFAMGKEQLDFRLTPEARAMGLSESDVARQVRNAFFGAEAVRQQRGRDEVRTYVRRPLAERESLYDIESLILQTPAGGEIPLGQAAEIERGRAYTQISRVDQRRIVRVSGDVEDGTSPGQVVAAIERDHMAGLLADFPGLRYRLAGDEKNRTEALGALGRGMLLALLAMFGLLAIAFKSYVQPIIVMSAIPFGMIGALLGHAMMGFDLSLMSMMGIVALSGVVVNDSLILIDAANRYRSEGQGFFEAIISAGQRRFRPILLTSLTTFFGLAPMIFETSMQARFLIPMALSLGFGVLFATFIILLLVPALYLIVEDVRARLVAGWRFVYGPLEEPVGGE
jgi:multidrug efflux pump subunit AcrB